MRKWYEQPMRVMQYNLQVADTPGMDAAKIARETEELACNVVVMNVGGIYAWYPSQVPYHHVNEFLPRDRDLLRELIDAFHQRNIKFVARFDFSITDDTTYLQKPQWFARHADKSPYFQGEKRMGNWSLFLSTCALNGYRNEEVAVPVMREALSKYDIDGVFFNAPMASPCHCEKCRAKYREAYGVPMPDDEMQWDPQWLSDCTKYNIGNVYRAIKETREEVPMILYYIPYSWKGIGFHIDRDSIYDRYQTADLICTEAQDVLSRGAAGIPKTAHPVLAMKAGMRDDEAFRPFGIIHSCPGMDWRHAGLPVAEYLPWMAQVPASGGVLWHSVTGYPDTIHDKRILHAIDQVDHMIAQTEGDMDGAKNCSEALVCWDGNDASYTLCDALLKNHITFDLMQDYAVSPERMKQYRLVLVPDGLLKKPDLCEAVTAYAAAGGKVLVECSDPDSILNMREVLGVQADMSKGEYLTASYMRIEEAGRCVTDDMETDKLPLRGQVVYCHPAAEAQTLFTLIPPFAPMDVVGRPPERASIPVPHTDIPLLIRHACGEGEVLFLPFSLTDLIREYKLYDHYHLVGRLADALLGRRRLEVNGPSTIHVTTFGKEKAQLIHLVNETGERPLRETVPVLDIRLSLAIPEGASVKAVRATLEGQTVTCGEKDGRLEILLPRLDVWQMIVVEYN